MGFEVVFKPAEAKDRGVGFVAFEHLNGCLGVSRSREKTLPEEFFRVVAPGGEFPLSDSQRRKPCGCGSNQAASLEGLNRVKRGGRKRHKNRAVAVVGIRVGAACERDEVARAVDDVKAVKTGTRDKDVDFFVADSARELIHCESHGCDVGRTKAGF